MASFIYVCSDCGRAFTTDDIWNPGIASKMIKSGVRTGTPMAGMYSANPTYRCPYCLSKNTNSGTEEQRLRYMLKKHSYPKMDPRWPALQIAQKYEDCYVNVNVAEKKVQGLSGDAENRLNDFINDCNWQLSSDLLKKMTATFSHGVICYRPAENTWTVYQENAIACAVRRGTTDDDYQFSADGVNFVTVSAVDQALLQKIDKAITDYSLLLQID